MSRYSAEAERDQGETLYTLRDAESSACARVWPGFGNNCLAARLAAPGGADGSRGAADLPRSASGRSPTGDGGLPGEGIDLLLAPQTLDQVRQQPSWWGIPLLFPWPGRIPRGEYEFAGQRHHLPVSGPEGNAIHGFAKDRLWRVEAAGGTDGYAYLRCAFTSADHPDTLAGYPFPYRLETVYQLTQGELTLRAAVANAGDTPMPFGFGAHPYFRVPLAPGGDRAACLVQVPADRRWNLARLGTLPPGERLTWEDVTGPVDGQFDLRRPQPLGDRQYDGGFTGLAARDGWIECSVADPAARLAAVMQATDNFGTVVLYTPPGRPGICFEPWTCPPNAFNLAARGVANSGLVVLQPGDRWEGSMRLFLRAAGG